MTPQHHLPADIERTSMRIITEELAQRGLTILPENAAVVKRVIHTTADFDYAVNLRFTPGAVAAGVAAVQSGANAVYLSFEDLTGCRRTENIPNSEFESVVRYCRIRGCRAYLALNIPVREDELNKAAGLALRAQRCGVDAITTDEVREILDINKAQRHIRGGLATREKYKSMKEENK